MGTSSGSRTLKVGMAEIPLSEIDKIVVLRNSPSAGGAAGDYQSFKANFSTAAYQVPTGKTLYILGNAGHVDLTNGAIGYADTAAGTVRTGTPPTNPVEAQSHVIENLTQTPLKDSPTGISSGIFPIAIPADKYVHFRHMSTGGFLGTYICLLL